MTIKNITRSMVLCAFSSISLMSVANNSELILGKWHCDFAMNQSGINMNMDFHTEYFNDGTGKGRATLIMKNEEMGLDLEFDVKATQTWYIEGNSIYETVTSGEVTSLKPSMFDAMLTDEELLPIGLQEVSEILELTESSYKMLSDGQQISCIR